MIYFFKVQYLSCMLLFFVPILYAHYILSTVFIFIRHLHSQVSRRKTVSIYHFTYLDFVSHVCFVDIIFTSAEFLLQWSKSRYKYFQRLRILQASQGNMMLADWMLLAPPNCVKKRTHETPSVSVISFLWHSLEESPEPPIHRHPSSPLTY